MIERMHESARPLTWEDLRTIESAIGVALPDEYRRFLLKYNGGRPTPNAFPIEDLALNPFGTIQVFFGIDDPVESCTLDWNSNVYQGRIPPNLLPIACDDGGDLVCLSLFGDDAGAVVFWDRHTEPSEPSYDNVYRIAGSFSAFIAGIRELPKSPSARG